MASTLSEYGLPFIFAVKSGWIIVKSCSSENLLKFFLFFKRLWYFSAMSSTFFYLSNPSCCFASSSASCSRLKLSLTLLKSSCDWSSFFLPPYFTTFKILSILAVNSWVISFTDSCWSSASFKKSWWSCCVELYNSRMFLFCSIMSFLSDACWARILSFSAFNFSHLREISAFCFMSYFSISFTHCCNFALHFSSFFALFSSCREMPIWEFWSFEWQFLLFSLYDFIECWTTYFIKFSSRDVNYF